MLFYEIKASINTMPNNSGLTKNEQRVLYGMVRNPTMSDNSLARFLKMKDSTVNYCRNQLEKRKIFQVVYVPILNRLGFELLCINFAEYNLKTLKDSRKSEKTNKIPISDDIFLRIGDLEKEFSVSFNKNYSEFFLNTQNRLERMGKLGLLSKNRKNLPKNIIFPINLSVIYNFFDYSQLLLHTFSIKSENGVKNNGDPLYFSDHTLYNLSEKEKAVFTALIDYPNYSIKEIAELEEISLNRNTVSKMRQDFLKLGLMKKIIIPDLQSIGYELLVYYHFRFRPDNPINDEAKGVLNSPSTILFFYNKFEAIILSAFKNYSEYKSDKVQKFSHLHSHEMLAESPEPRKYLFNNLDYFRKFDFRLLSRNI